MKDYSDMMTLSRPVSERHAPMTRHDRAAQFSPFAALTGYEAVIAETGRLTDSRVELTEGRKEQLDRVLREALAPENRHLSVAVVWFCPDLRKRGGRYVKTVGQIKKADALLHLLLMNDGTVIPVEDIFDIEIQWP